MQSVETAVFVQTDDLRYRPQSNHRCYDYQQHVAWQPSGAVITLLTEFRRSEGEADIFRSGLVNYD